MSRRIAKLRIHVQWDILVNTDVCERAGVFPSMWRFDEGSAKWLQLPDPLELPALEADDGSSSQLPPVDLSIAEAQAPPQGRVPAVASDPGSKDRGGRGLARKKGKGGPALTASEREKEAAALHSAQLVRRFVQFFNSSKGKKLRARLRYSNAWFKIAGISRHLNFEWKDVRAAAVGQDYASRTHGNVQSDGKFEMLVQSASLVSIEIDLGTAN